MRESGGAREAGAEGGGGEVRESGEAREAGAEGGGGEVRESGEAREAGAEGGGGEVERGKESGERENKGEGVGEEAKGTETTPPQLPLTSTLPLSPTSTPIRPPIRHPPAPTLISALRHHSAQSSHWYMRQIFTRR